MCLSFSSFVLSPHLESKSLRSACEHPWGFKFIGPAIMYKEFDTSESPTNNHTVAPLPRYMSLRENDNASALGDLCVEIVSSVTRTKSYEHKESCRSA